ncbi:response regulator transcription factor [Clostridium omnivorum]|uniref:Stage 0 sporulation protein A homolog n=1 Tax=Clostridium omnivorum TaxID=1604902 RepID=A0ABQ5N7T6_9CLOT|nr:response regulator [Clostridium sp. E14]GLC31264.1 hypothetical protein bsdE14_26740 [Clostridium sp. E14]
MYNLVIADDEKNIREGLAKFIDWEELGFKVVFKCEDGEEVIDYMNSMAVDVILCDIRMNKVSGLDVAKYAFENFKGVKIVLISGYQEFEYAKKALEYNVFSYIVKPIDIEEIKEKFLKIKKDLDHKKYISQEIKEDKIKIEEAQNRIKELMGNPEVTIERTQKSILKYQEALIDSFLNFDKDSICSYQSNISSELKLIPFTIGLKFLKNTLVLLYNSIENQYSGLIIKDDLKRNIKEISLTKDYNNAINIFEKWINVSIEAIEQNNSSNIDLVIKRANRYIEDNYSEDLTLEKVAEHVYLSPVYLSKIYKKKMGVNFIDYVTNIRIERAKELLSNRHIKVYEISGLVGYKNLKYFYKVFKNYTGLTPNKYREIILSSKSDDMSKR